LLVCAVLGTPDEEEVILFSKRGELSFDVEEDDLYLAEGFFDDFAKRVAFPAAAVRLQQQARAQQDLDIERCRTAIRSEGSKLDDFSDLASPSTFVV
jgi:hypothetical protein